MNVCTVEIEPLASYRWSISCATLTDVFRYLVKFPDGLLHDPGVFVTAVPFWKLADTLRVGDGRLLRILSVDTRIDHTLLAAGIQGVFTVEVVR